jgi:hypothetical protein
MKHFLLVYDKSTGQLLEERQFDDYREALSARFSVEKRQASALTTLEVVVLSASSRDELLRTHARYFLTIDQLAMRMSRD